jgi:hypothetical protein
MGVSVGSLDFNIDYSLFRAGLSALHEHPRRCQQIFASRLHGAPDVYISDVSTLIFVFVNKNEVHRPDSGLGCDDPVNNYPRDVLDMTVCNILMP